MSGLSCGIRDPAYLPHVLVGRGLDGLRALRVPARAAELDEAPVVDGVANRGGRQLVVAEDGVLSAELGVGGEDQEAVRSTSLTGESSAAAGIDLSRRVFPSPPPALHPCRQSNL